MFRKSIYSLTVIAALIAALSLAAAAQTAVTSGRVFLQKDGAKTPIADASVDVFYTDQKGGAPSTTTNKKGDFSFAGLMIGASYVLSVSAPGCEPAIIPIKAGKTGVEILLDPGSGKKLTEDEVREQLAIAKANPGGKVDPKAEADQAKAQAEYEAKLKAAQAKNEKIKATFEKQQQLIKEGDAAAAAQNYDLAIAKFDEGYHADEEFAGSAPTFLEKKANSLIQRAVISNNKAAKLTNPEQRDERVALQTSARKDLGDAAEAFKMALAMIPGASETDLAKPNATQLTNFGLSQIVEIVRIAGRTRLVDARITPIAVEYVPKYIAAEADPAKKAAAKNYIAEYYLNANEPDKAIEAYRDVLATSPNDVDALAGLGLSLVNAGYVSQNNEQLQEGANYLQKFVAVAPDNHRYKADAVGLLESLKKDNNVTPQKGAKKKN